jgi:hypothetical protein
MKERSMMTRGFSWISAAALVVAVCFGGCGSDDDDGGGGTETDSGTGTGDGTAGDDGGTSGDDGGTGGDSGGTGTGTGDDGGTGTGGTGTGGTDTGGTGTGGTDTGGTDTGGTDTGGTTDTDGTDTGGTDTGATTGGFGDANCGLLMDCISMCQDQPCVDACLAEATPEAQGEADDLLQCVVDNGCGNDMQCVLDNCGTEYEECFTGDLDCAEMAACMENCGGDPDCESWCYYEGTADAQEQYAAIWECADFHNCQDYACIQTNCGEELDACFG